MLNRAYSLLQLKKVDEEQRQITGMATTPAADRIGDVVESEGAQYTLPMPLLWQHDAGQPIGQVTHAKVGKDGIEIVARIAKGVTAEIDKAWALIKAGLVPGLSIGFKAIEREFIKGAQGIRFKKWEWLETSAVTIPANATATIQTIKSIDAAQRAASGHRMPHGVVRLNPPGASGPDNAQEGAMTTIAEQITKLESKRAASAARMEAIMQKTLDEERTSDAAEQDEFDKLNAELEAVDKDLVRLRRLEQAKAHAARPVIKAETAREGADLRGNSSIIVRGPVQQPEGFPFAQVVRCVVRSQREYRPAGDIARELYGPDALATAHFVQKAPVAAGTTLAGNWLEGLIGEETSAVADFVTYLRKRSILGQFGNNGVPALRNVMFRVPLITQTSGGAGYWVGESKAKPLTSLSFTRTTLEPLKVANICVLTEEAIKYSSPKADAIIRDSLVAALRERLDTDFISPSKTAVAGVSPASITNGAETIASSGDDADDIRLDVRSVYAKFSAANNPISTGVWIMSSNTAGALAMITNPLGQPEFSSMVNGNSLFRMPVIVSDFVSDIVVLVNAEDIYLADEGQVAVDTSREASLEMSDGPTHNSGTPTAAQLVSMFQTNSVAIRAEMVVNWQRRRDLSVVYLTGVSWGGEVNTA